MTVEGDQIQYLPVAPKTISSSQCDCPPLLLLWGCWNRTGLRQVSAGIESGLGQEVRQVKVRVECWGDTNVKELGQQHTDGENTSWQHQSRKSDVGSVNRRPGCLESSGHRRVTWKEGGGETLEGFGDRVRSWLASTFDGKLSLYEIENPLWGFK